MDTHYSYRLLCQSQHSQFTKHLHTTDSLRYYQAAARSSLTAPPTGRFAPPTFMKDSQSSLEQTGSKCQVRFTARGILAGKISLLTHGSY